MEEGIRKFGEVEGIDVYYDKLMGNDNVIIGHKQGSIHKQGYIWIPIESFIGVKGIPLRNFDEPVKSTPVTIENINFIIGGSLDLDRYRFLLEKIKQAENNRL